MFALSAAALALVAATVGLLLGVLLAAARLDDARREAAAWRRAALDLLDREPAAVAVSDAHSASLRIVAGGEGR